MATTLTIDRLRALRQQDLAQQRGVSRPTYTIQ